MDEQLKQVDGYYICPDCKGTGYGSIMNQFHDMIDPMQFANDKVHFCSKCGINGKIDWVSYSMGKRFDEDAVDDIDDKVKLIGDYVIYKYMLSETTFNNYNDYITDELIGVDDPDVEHMFGLLYNYFSSGWDYDNTYYNNSLFECVDLDHVMFVANELGLKPVEVDCDTMFGEMPRHYRFEKYINNAIGLTMYRDVFFEVCRSIDERGLLPTSSVDHCIDIARMFGFEFENNEFDEFVKFASEKLSDMFEDVVELIKDETNMLIDSVEMLSEVVKNALVNNIPSIEELESQGVLLFDKNET